VPTFVSQCAFFDPLFATRCPSGARVMRTRIATGLVAHILFAAALGAQSVADTASVRAESLFAAKNYAGAAEAFEALTRAHPQQVRYWTRLGTSLQLASRPDAAIAAYRRAIGLGPSAVAMYNLATVFAARGQKDSAFHWLDQALGAGFTNATVVSNDAEFASLKSDARFAALLERMRTATRPCLTRKESRMFDFWVGQWDVRTPQGQLAGRSSVQLLLEGCTLLENWTDTQGSSGKSLNSYNPDTKQWQQFWTSQSGTVTEYRESEWVNGSLVFKARQILPQGPALLRMTFTPINPDRVRQHGETSFDEGKTWATSFDLYYHRRK
jgi:hypothetical protein